MRKLTEREKLLLKIGGGVLAVFLIYAMLTPIMYIKNEVANVYKTNTEQLKRLDATHEEYSVVVERNRRVETMLKDAQSPAALIESIAEELNIKRNQVYNRTNQTVIQNQYTRISSDVKFEGIDIRSALMFVNRIENTDRIVNVSYLRIAQALRERKTYDVTLKIDIYRLD